MTKKLDDLAPTERLLAIMARLRDPDTGCPWDLQQDFASIAPYTIEEAYEVADAIAKDDMPHLRDELGDLLLQVVFHAQMADEKQAFNFQAVAESICDKMIKRHPHIFSSRELGTEIDGAAAQTLAWEDQKATERALSASETGRPLSALDGVATALPALMRAEKLQKRAARIGFDWPEVSPVWGKISEEMAELKAEIAAGDQDAMAEEMGDLLFSVVNLARHLKIDPESALRAGNDKFERRFRSLEKDLADQGHIPVELDIKTLEQAWKNTKNKENP